MTKVCSASLLGDPDTLPLLPATTVQGFGSTLVVAPHPDDETLGCGGAIALLRHLGCPVQVLVISDGIRSHPNSRTFPPAALRTLREEETQSALSMLGVESAAITFLRWQDQGIPTPGTLDFEAAVVQCGDYLATRIPTTIFLPWRYDPHLDHRLSWQLVQTALSAHHGSRLIEYPIWAWDVTQRSNVALPTVFSAWRLDICTVVCQKLAAIAAHRSQTTDLINDDPEGFRLTPEMLTHFAHPWELYLEAIDE